MSQLLGYSLLITGLILLALGASLLALDPPRTITYSRTLSIPYISYKTLAPGIHNYTEFRNIDSFHQPVNLPGEKTIELNVQSMLEGNYTVIMPRLIMGFEGFLNIDGKQYINVTIKGLINNRSVLIDHIYIPINPTELPVTPTPYTTVMYVGESGSSFKAAQETGTVSINVFTSDKGYLKASAYRTGEGKIKVELHSSIFGFPVPRNTSRIIIIIESNATGEIYMLARTLYELVYTYYLDKPEYIPVTNYQFSTITTSIFHPGSLVESIILLIIGLALIQISLIAFTTSKEGGSVGYNS